ncbi:MAG: flavin reductase family protein [Leptospirales bacterium]
MHRICKPSILYFGTPVVLISTTNEDGTPNLAPMSSVFWLGWRCILGLASSSKTTQNMIRTGECVLNLPSVEEVAAVDRLALTTGSNPVPERKVMRGYRFESDKFGVAGLTPLVSRTVKPPAVLECPVHLESTVESIHGIAEEDPALRGRLVCVEVRIRCVQVEESIMMCGEDDRVDPDKWRPLIMSFQKYYGLGSQVHPSRLSHIPESMYRTSDMGSVG